MEGAVPRVDTVFDRLVKRDGDQGKLHSESDFSFINRSADVAMAGAREVIESWFARYPPEHRFDLRNRLREGDFNSAFFELYLHEMLVRMDYSLTIEAPAGTKGRSPDFHVRGEDRADFYLEARVISGRSREQAAAERRANQVYEEIDKLVSADFFVGIECSKLPSEPLSGREIRAFLKEKLDATNWDELVPLYLDGGPAAMPRWRFADLRWPVEFFPIPKQLEDRGKQGIRPLGMLFHDFGALEDLSFIRHAISQKAKRYGDLNAPFIVAVNLLSGFADEDAVVSALYGRRTRTFLRLGNGKEIVTDGRDDTGLWSSAGPHSKLTRLSGILVVLRAEAWNVPSSRLLYCSNPWANSRLPDPFPRLPRIVLFNDRLERRRGASSADLFELEAYDGRQ